MFNIIPQPNEMIITGGKTYFELNEDTTITKVPYIDEFRDFVKKRTVWSPATVAFTFTARRTTAFFTVCKP